MHSYGCYILDRYKEIRRYSLGNIRKTSLKEIWEATITGLLFGILG